MNKKEISYKGDSFKTIKDLARKLNIPYKLLIGRIKAGLPEERWGDLNQKLITYNVNKYESIKKISKKINISYNILYRRIKEGLPEEEWDKKVVKEEKLTYKGKLFNS